MDYLEKVIELRKQIYQLQYEHYINVTLFSIKWWILFVTAIITITIWWKLVDKNRFHEIALVGFVTMVLTIFSDSFGLDMVLWAYPTQLYELVKSVSVIELVVMAISYMLMYQYFSNWKKYITALIIFASLGAFVGIPVAVWFGFYKLIKWRYVYSFIIFICLGISIKFIVSKIIDIQERHIKYNHRIE